MYSLPLSLLASDGVIGENPGLNFYGRIDETAGEVTDWLINKRLSEYPTFARFGRYCRPALPWLDSARMEKQILEEVQNGYYGSISAFASKKWVSLSSESMNNLTVCLAEAYAQLQKWAYEQYESLSTMGSMWLYMDWNTANSDYDIIADIEKINGLIFTEEMPYKGTKNEGKTSLSNLLKWKIVSPLISDKEKKEILNTPETPPEPSPTPITPPSPETLKDLNVDGCATTTIAGLTNQEFIDELSQTLQGWRYPINQWKTYDPTGPTSPEVTPPTVPEKTFTSSKDFFWTQRCEWVFCIKFSKVSSSINLLGGRKNVSIETMLDKHIEHNKPISWQNGWLQLMTSNMMQLPCTWFACDLKNMVKWGGIYLVVKSGKKERSKKVEQTPEFKDAKLEQAVRCWFYSAGFSTSNLAMVNSVQGAGFITTTSTNTANIKTSEKHLWVIDTDARALAGCMDVAIESGREAYYTSFSDDLTEIKTFTESFIKVINDVLGEWEKIDTLPVK